MSYSSGPGPAGPPNAGPTGPAGPYAAPGYAPPTGPYGPVGPYAGPGPYGGQGGPPPRKKRGGLIAVLVIVGVVVVAGVVFAAVTLFGGSGDIGDLPAPKALGSDPVPADKHVTARPPHCGVRGATAKALIPGASPEKVGGDCFWSGAKAYLLVQYIPSKDSRVDPSRVAAAIGRFQNATSATQSRTDGTYTPLTGLGEDAAYSAGPDSGGDGVRADVVFRTGDLVIRATYKSADAAASASGRFRRGALRTAVDVARSLGVAANPAPARVSRQAPATVPGDVCGLVTKDLTEVLGDTGDPLTHRNGDDLIVDKDVIPSATTSGCDSIATSSSRDYSSRVLEAHVTGPTKPGADADVAREYLRVYDRARAERPAAPGGARYFRALSGLGDQAFCSYIAGKREIGIGQDGAEIVVRKGTALITVTFGAESAGTGLTEQQTINGAYAAAVKVAAGVR